MPPDWCHVIRLPFLRHQNSQLHSAIAVRTTLDTAIHISSESGGVGVSGDMLRVNDRLSCLDACQTAALSEKGEVSKVSMS